MYVCFRYEAEDKPGIDTHERFRRRVNLRNWLLAGVNFAHFPPYGSYVHGIPVVMFEGILCNIDRRLQLHVLAEGGIYNVRAPSSLDSENFFSEFSCLDPKGSGVLRPDDIPCAMQTASYLIQARTDPDR